METGATEASPVSGAVASSAAIWDTARTGGTGAISAAAVMSAGSASTALRAASAPVFGGCTPTGTGATGVISAAAASAAAAHSAATACALGVPLLVLLLLMIDGGMLPALLAQVSSLLHPIPQLANVLNQQFWYQHMTQYKIC